jgi:hypothetical protein
MCVSALYGVFAGFDGFQLLLGQHAGIALLRSNSEHSVLSLCINRI